MVTIEAEIQSPVGEKAPRMIYAFGLVKVKFGGLEKDKATRTNEMSVLGLVVVDHTPESKNNVPDGSL